jgi:putative hydrolase of the HAD superfamily
VSARPITTVFLDVGGTLISPNPSFSEIYHRVLAPLGVVCTEADLQRAAREAWVEMDGQVGRGNDRYSHFPGGEREYWGRYVREVLRRVSAEETTDAAARALAAAFADRSAWAVFPEVPAVLERLGERGYKLAVISNWDSRLRALLAGLGLATAFESIIVSSEVGAEKPAPEIFSRALRSIGSDPDEAIHVGDDYVCDYQGARAAGIDALLLVRRGEPVDGARVIRTLDPLLDLLPGLGGGASGADPRS